LDGAGTVFAIGCWLVGAAGTGIADAPGVTTVVLTGPDTFGLLALPVFMLSAPGGTLLAGSGALDAAFGDGGDWLAPLWANAGAAARRSTKAGTIFSMDNLHGIWLPASNVGCAVWFDPHRHGCHLASVAARPGTGGPKMTNRLRLVAVILCCCLAAGAGARAASSACSEHFAGGQAPDLLNPRLAPGSRALCFRAFAVLHSAATRTALYSAEHLTDARIASARGLPRDSEFHAESALPAEERAELSDYARSGFDRGHMAPSGDMPDAESQQESFSLANMVPQAPKLNRGIWEGIESAVRKLAEREGDIYVVTGPIYQGADLQQVGNVLVPSHVFKAVLNPQRRLAAAYVAKNVDSAPWAAVSMRQLADLTGMDVFPILPDRAKSTMLRLPAPTPHGYQPRRNRGNMP